mgnify:CR=1 FL=1
MDGRLAVHMVHAQYPWIPETLSEAGCTFAASKTYGRLEYVRLQLVRLKWGQAVRLRQGVASPLNRPRCTHGCTKLAVERVLEQV